MSRLFMLIALVFVVACGGDSSSSSGGPSGTTSSVSVTVNSPIRMGQTAQATGSATQSNGQTQPVTSGWRSDATAVATVTDAGLVSGIANGRATIYVVSGGRQGQQVVRVVPDYQGRWFGALRITSCSQTGIFVEISLCEDFATGDTGSYFLSLAQSGESMTATVDYGEGIVFPPASAPILEDGTSSFASTLTVSDEGITVSLGTNFSINSARVGELTGTAFDVWRLPNIQGEMRVSYTLTNMTRTSATALTAPGDRSAKLRRSLRKLAGQNR